MSALGIENDPGQVAWLLIRWALTKAIYSLVAENAHVLRRAGQSLDALGVQLDLSLEDREFHIDNSFFEKPGELSLLDAIQLPFTQWLKEFGLGEAQAKLICARLNTYFVFALNDEWRSRPKDYIVLKEALDTPFAKASKREQEWLRYLAWLQKQIDERMFDLQICKWRIWPGRIWKERFCRRVLISKVLPERLKLNPKEPI